MRIFAIQGFRFDEFGHYIEKGIYIYYIEIEPSLVVAMEIEVQ